MIKETSINSFFRSYFIVIPLVIGAQLSGVFYLAEGGVIPLTLFQLGLLLALFLFITNMLIEQRSTIELYGLEKVYLVFFILISFSILYSPEKPQALFYFIRFVVLIFMTYVIYNSIQDEKEFKTICLSLIFIATVLAIYSLANSYFNPEKLLINYVNQGRNLIRESGVESDPNLFASNFFIPLMLSAALFSLEENRKLKTVFLLSFLIMIGAVLLTYSRSSWVAIFFGLLVVIIYTRSYNLLVYGFIGFLILFISSETVRNISYSFFTRLQDIFAGTQDDSSNIRILLAKTSVLMIFDTYLMGVGFQGFSTAFQKYHPPQETIGIYEPHNEFYTVFSEVGILGFIVFLVLIYSIFKKAKFNTKLLYHDKRLKPISIALFASFICYLIFYQFYGGMFYNSVMMILIGIIFSISKFGKLQPPNSHISSN